MLSRSFLLSVLCVFVLLAALSSADPGCPDCALFRVTFVCSAESSVTAMVRTNQAVGQVLTTFNSVCKANAQALAINAQVLVNGVGPTISMRQTAKQPARAVQLVRRGAVCTLTLCCCRLPSCVPLHTHDRFELRRALTICSVCFGCSSLLRLVMSFVVSRDHPSIDADVAAPCGAAVASASVPSPLTRMPSVLVQWMMQLLDIVSQARLAATCKLMHADAMSLAAALTASSFAPPDVSEARLEQLRSSLTVDSLVSCRLVGVWRVGRVSRIERNRIAVWVAVGAVPIKLPVSQLRPGPPTFVRSMRLHSGAAPNDGNPQGVCVSDGRVYVSHNSADDQHRVRVFTTDGSTLFLIQGGQTPMRGPAEVAVADAFVYVVDQQHHRVCVFNAADGTFVRTWGSGGSENMQFRFPYGVAVVGSLLYVSDSLNHRIQVFRLSGDGNVTHHLTWGSEGDQDGQLKCPGGLAVSDGLLYIADSSNHRIQAFRAADGQFIRKWGSEGKGDGQLRFPQSVAVANGLAYVTDRISHRVCVFNAADGQFLRAWGVLGTAVGQFRNPRGLWVADGLLYVADRNNRRVCVFQCG